MFDYSVTPEFEELFSAASKPTEKTTELQDVMNFGDIEVGVNQGSDIGCAGYIVGFFIFLLVLGILGGC